MAYNCGLLWWGMMVSTILAIIMGTNSSKEASNNLKKGPKIVSFRYPLKYCPNAFIFYFLKHMLKQAHQLNQIEIEMNFA